MSAEEVIRHEAATLTALADNLDGEAFERAVRLVAGCTGNVATVGMGTSGIVARKIAATLTSTGTPAHFVHPSDALHGGLGLIGGQGLVIAVSNGGETEEVLGLLPYLATRDVPVIAIVGRGESALGRQAQVTLEARAEREAGQLDIVPTASVVAALAIGDALALTVMELKGITPEGFALNHPSGRLGRRLTLRVRDVMHTDIEPCDPATPLLEVVTAITAGGVGAAVVLADGALAGLVTDGDVRRALQREAAHDLSALTAADVMTREPVVVQADAMAFDALRLMEDRPSQIHVLPVLDGDAWAGMLRLHDLARLGL